MMNRNKVLIIAEAGVNHNGSFELAKRMIEVAKEAGADYVKFQTAVPELVYSANTPKAAYQVKNTGSDEPQIEMAKKIHLPVSAYKELQAYCKEVGVGFLSTPFDLVSVDVLIALNMDYFKIASGEITNLPYLRRIANSKVPVILSTGMCNLGDIEAAIELFLSHGYTRTMISLLHCNTEYPTPMRDVNLNAMLTLRNAFGLEVGYSDHTEGVEIPVAAVAMGGTIIEKHFTLDKAMDGPDHKASLDPFELKEMVRVIRNVEQAMGDGIKKPSPSESKNVNVARKSIHIAKAVKAGEILKEEDLTAKRPGDGISPMLIDSFVGLKVKSDLPYDHKLSYGDLIY